MEIVEIFKTNVQETCQAKEFIVLLMKQFPGIKANFDLNDCDKILRVVSENTAPSEIITFVNVNGFECKVLE